jgi:hypothetical protein
MQYGPKVVTNGLVLGYDASDRNSCLPNSLINMNNWVVGTGGVTNYNQNGNPATENQRFAAANPWGHTGIIWGSFPSGNGNDDGGWNTTDINIDNTKLYRFSVWVKRTSSTSGGTFYFGMNAGGDGPRQMDNSTVNTNPYWNCISTGSLTQDVWYLYVGHVYPWNTSYTGRHPDTGYYFVNNPVKQGDINGCNIGTGDLKWSSNSTTGIHRTYHYYCADSTTRLQFYDPRVDLIDGKQPSIAELTSRSPIQWRDISGNNYNLVLSHPNVYTTYNNVRCMDFENGIAKYLPSGTLTDLPVYPNITICMYSTIKPANGNWKTLWRNTSIDHQVIISSSDGVSLGMFDNDAGNFIDTGFDVNTLSNYTTQFHFYVWKLSSSSPYYQFYYDGNLSSSSGTLTNVNAALTRGTACIGGIHSGTNDPAVYDQNWGRISNFYYYNRHLSESELQQIYKATKARFGL